MTRSKHCGRDCKSRPACPTSSVKHQIMAGHHLILGELADFITGEILEDTLDERYKQNLARLLINKKGYFKNEVQPRCDLLVTAGSHRAIVKVDFKITLTGLSPSRTGVSQEGTPPDPYQGKNAKVCMIIKYGPGSLVTRQRPALAASRLLMPYQIPIVVVTNGEDADVMDGSTGKVISAGFESVPSRSELIHHVENASFDPIPAKQAEMESRIVYAFEVDGSCPCDDTLCRLE